MRKLRLSEGIEATQGPCKLEPQRRAGNPVCRIPKCMLIALIFPLRGLALEAVGANLRAHLSQVTSVVFTVLKRSKVGLL